MNSKFFINNHIKRKISVFIVILCSVQYIINNLPIYFSITSLSYSNSYFQNNNLNDISASSFNYLTPTPLINNEPSNLADTEQSFYHVYPSSKPFMIELNRSLCTNRINFWLYSDDLYKNEIYFTTTGEDITRIFVQNQTFVYYIKTICDLTTCDPIIPSQILIRAGETIINNDTVYNMTVRYDEPTILYIDLLEGARYKMNFNASTPNTHLKFDFYYAEEGRITRDFYHTYHYNNGEFTARESTRAMLFLTAYEPGEYNFTFKISVISLPEKPLTINTDLILFLILVCAGLVYIVFWMIKRKQDRY
ncbi:MAG: hypothetical protein ACTSRZ_03320 [Promethearchaeota archaeon]